MPKPGRKPLIDETKKAEIAALMTAGCSLFTAAKYVGCQAYSIVRAANRDPKFAERLRQAELTHELTHLRNILKAGEKNWRASAWALEKTRPLTYNHPPKLWTAEQVQAMISQFGDLAVRELPEEARLRFLKKLQDQSREYILNVEAGRDPLNPRKKEPAPPHPAPGAEFRSPSPPRAPETREMPPCRSRGSSPQDQAAPKVTET